MESPVLLVSRTRAAQLLSVSERTIDRLCDAGQLQRVKVGRAARVLAASIDEYLARALEPRATGPLEPAPSPFVIPALEAAKRQKQLRGAALGAAA